MISLLKHVNYEFLRPLQVLSSKKNPDQNFRIPGMITYSIVTFLFQLRLNVDDVASNGFFREMEHLNVMKMICFMT